MEIPKSGDRSYVSYLYSIKDSEMLQRDGPEILTMLIDLGFYHSAEIMLLEMNVRERNRSRDESLYLIIDQRAYNLYLASNSPENFTNSLSVMIKAYEPYVKNLSGFMDIDSDKRSILREFRHILRHA